MITHKPKETCHLGRDYLTDPLIIKFMADEHSYIHEHLETLMLLVDLNKPNSILEIGTGAGYSTLAFAEACAVNGKGHIVTIDINDCVEAKAAIQHEELGSFVTFLQGNSLEVPISGKFDIIFIDGLHTKKQVKLEIERFRPMLNEDGFMIFHDTFNPAHPGVKEAVDEFTRINIFEWRQHDYFHCNGLTILRHSPDD